MQRTNHRGHMYIQALKILLLLTVLLGDLWLPGKVWAAPLTEEGESTPIVGLIPRPISPEPDTPVELSAFTVDATYDANHPDIMHMVVRVKLHNTSRTETHAVTLDVRGYTNQHLPISPLLATEGKDPARATVYPHPSLTRTLRPEQRLWLTFVYTDTVGNAPWVMFEYHIDKLQAWPTPVRSARVTIHSTPPLEQGALLEVSPPLSRNNGRALEWQWDGRTPSEPLRVFFIAPHHWQRIQQLREGVNQGDEEARRELAEWLTQWLTQPETPPPVWQAFYPEVVALWTQEASAHPDDPTPYRILAQLYRDRAQYSDNPDAYQSLILDALEKAWDRGARDATIRVALAKATREHIQRLRREKRWSEALKQLQHLRSILGPTGEREIQHLREQIALDWVKDRLAVHDQEGVLNALQAGWGDTILNYFRPHLPAFHYADVRVHTTQNRREITLSVFLNEPTPPTFEEDWNTWLKTLPTALPEAEIQHHSLGPQRTVTVTFPFATASDITEAQHMLTDSMPDLPEWAPLKDALSPQELVFTRTPRMWGYRMNWQETLSLTQARQRLDEVATDLRVSAQTPLPPDFPEILGEVRQAFREQDIRAWQAYRDAFHAVYTITWEEGWGPPAGSRLVLRTGETGTLHVAREVVYPRQAYVLGGLLFLAWTGLSWGLWRWLGE